LLAWIPFLNQQLLARDQKIKRVVAIAPSSVVWAGILRDWKKVPDSSWTAKGKPLAHVAFKPTGPVNQLLNLYSQSLANRSEKGAANIQVENIHGNVVLMTGENDEIWPSPMMAKQVCEKMNFKQKDQCQHLNFKGLDHLLDFKFIDPSEPMNHTLIKKLNGE